MFLCVCLYVVFFCSFLDFSFIPMSETESRSTNVVDSKDKNVK